MTPLSLGIFAAANQSAPSTSYESIATVSVGSGGASDATFSSIPSTYTHLQVRGLVLGSAAASGSLSCQVNSDTGSNYTSHLVGGNGSIAYAYGATGRTYADIYGYYDNLANNNYPVGFVMDILDYKDTNKYKTIRVLSGMDKNGNNYGEIFLKSSVWMSTSAISTLKIYISGQNMAQYSNIALYGIKAA